VRAALVVVAVVALAVVAPAAHAGRGGPLLRYLDDDTTQVVVFDVAHARGTPMFSRVVAIARQSQARWWRSLSQDEADPERAVDTIVIGTSPRGTVVVVEGRLDLPVARAPMTGKWEVHLGVPYWISDDKELCLLDHRLVITSTGSMPKVIDRARGKLRATGFATARALVEDASDGSDVFGGFAVDGTRGAVFGGDTAPTKLTFSVAVAAQMTIDVAIALRDAAAAHRLQGVIGDQLADPTVHGQLETFVGKDFVDSIASEVAGSQLRLSATLTADEVDRVSRVLASLL
jgi:hypothetical protein